MALADFFSADYRSARARFVLAADRHSWRRQVYDIGVDGPAGESLSIDMAALGSPSAENVVVISSGLHGVEGFFGSAVQLAFIEQHSAGLGLTSNAAIILVHALNPFGFAWRRRWNENNVDLNRNFLTDYSFPDRDPEYLDSRNAYARLYRLLNPGRPPSRIEPYAMKALAAIFSQGWAERARLPSGHRPAPVAIGAILGLGLAQLRKTIPVGQYEYPDGLFFGGTRLERTTHYLRETLPGWVGQARRIIHVDFHTGLGQHGKYKLFVGDEENSEPSQRAARWFGAENVEPWGGDTAYRGRGLMATHFASVFGDWRYLCLTAEFGTYPATPVLRALRAEHQAHRFSRPGSANYEWAKRQLVEAFCPKSRSWRESAVEQGLGIIKRAVSVCFGR
ncbi:MAG TPA: DUF2817 domain-containing protein [Burkholderiales bacterium]|nr:DUF2817 domain-containing protein [Burkholderiales bacterium]